MPKTSEIQVTFLNSTSLQVFIVEVIDFIILLICVAQELYPKALISYFSIKVVVNTWKTL